MAEDPPTLETPKSDDNINNNKNSNLQSNDNPSPAGDVPISINSSSTLFAPLQIPPPLPPSFRHVMNLEPQFVPAQSHPSYQNPNSQPAGMSGGLPMPPGQMMQQQQQQNQPLGMRLFVPMPNGYPPQQPPHQGTVPIPVS